MRDWESFQRKLDAAHALLVRKGLARGKRKYFLTRVLWSAGIAFRPALFASYRSNFLVHGGLFAVCWGSVTWVFSWQDQEQSALALLLWSGITGVICGSVTATHCRWLARKHKLPDWDELPDVVDVFD